MRGEQDALAQLAPESEYSCGQTRAALGTEPEDLEAFMTVALSYVCSFVLRSKQYRKLSFW
jgi:hypothetical protein